MPNVYFKLIYTYSFIMLHSCVDKYMQKQMVTEFLNHLHIYNPTLLSQVLAYSFWICVSPFNIVACAIQSLPKQTTQRNRGK